MLIEFLTSRFSYLIDGIAGLVAFVLFVKYANRSLGIKDFAAQILQDMTGADRAQYFGRRIIAMGLVFAGIALAGAIQ